ncbi:SDA1-domain-containing protein, partial [Aureobasidium melanogenum]
MAMVVYPTAGRAILRKPKKIICALDGTWQDSDSGWVNGALKAPSNVTRISRAIKPEDSEHHAQIVYYQAGIGTGLGLRDRLLGGGTGLGLSEHIREAYYFIANNYSPGDSIFLIGFSRGSFTARSVGGLIGNLGLLNKTGLPFFYEIFLDWENAGNPDSEGSSFWEHYRDPLNPDRKSMPQTPSNDPARVYEYLNEYRASKIRSSHVIVATPDLFEVLRSFGLTHVVSIRENELRDVPIRAIGVWETVGALGIPVNPWFQKHFGLPGFLHEYKWLDTKLSDNVENAFQALALDEHRAPFSPAVWEKPEGSHTYLKQTWFPGAHSNVGGSYDDTATADISLAWMMDQLSGGTQDSTDTPLDKKDWIEFYDDYLDTQQALNKVWYESNPPMVKRKVGALEKVDADLPNLQYKVRRDPASYKDDFNNQYSQYQAFLQLFMQAPSSTDSQGLVSLRELIDFVAHCADCYPKLTANFPTDLMALLRLHHAELEPELRDKVVGSLVLLRKKEIIDSAVLLNALFPLLVDTPSKALRTLLFTKIISDLRTSNSKATNHKLNRTIQTVLYNLLTSDPTSAKGVWAVRITREMWARQIWTDAKAVEIMKEAALSQHEKVVTGGVHFFLGGDKEREEKAEEDSDDDENIDMGKLRHQAGINKKTKKKANELKRAAATVRRKEKKKKAPHPLNFSALHLLHDPQGFAEKLFHQHLNTQTPKAKLKLDQKLIVLQLVSRLVGLHTLTLIPLYSYFIKYLTPKQPQVTSFLASLAQSTHNLVPPDALEPLVQKIANEFVSEAAASEVASAGLNAIREICVRQPLAMNETLLQDLVEYRKSKDKGVMMAAKGLLSLYREVGPEMLRRRDRGKDASIGIQKGTLKDRKFGQVEVGGIEGLELLEEWKAEERRKRRIEKGLDPEASDADEDDEEEDEEAGWSKWDLEEDDDSDEEGWINVESDGEEINISDSE